MKNIQIGSCTLYLYGLAIAAAVSVTVLFSVGLEKRAFLPKSTLSRLLIFCLPCGVLGARLGYCLCVLDGVSGSIFSFFIRFTSGGYMLYAGMVGVFFGVCLMAALTRQSVLKLTDFLAAPAALLIALIRLADGIAQEGYGWDIADWFAEDSGMSIFALEDSSFFCRFPFGISDMYGSWNWSIFLLEALVAAGILLLLMKTHCDRPGGKTALLTLLYTSSQILCESMRQDAVLRFGFVRINQVISAILLTALCVFLLAKNKETSKGRASFTVSGLLLCFLVVTAMEFAIEKKISAIEWVPIGMCHIVMAAACAGLIALIYPQWKKYYIITENPMIKQGGS